MRNYDISTSENTPESNNPEYDKKTEFQTSIKQAEESIKQDPVRMEEVKKMAKANGWSMKKALLWAGVAAVAGVAALSGLDHLGYDFTGIGGAVNSAASAAWNGIASGVSTFWNRNAPTPVTSQPTSPNPDALFTGGYNTSPTPKPTSPTSTPIQTPTQSPVGGQEMGQRRQERIDRKEWESIMPKAPELTSPALNQAELDSAAAWKEQQEAGIKFTEGYNTSPTPEPTSVKTADLA